MRSLLSLLLTAALAGCTSNFGEEEHLAGYWEGTLRDEVSQKVYWAELDLYPGGHLDYWLFYDAPGVFDTEEYASGEFWFDGQTAELEIFSGMDLGVFSPRYLAIGEMDYGDRTLSGDLYDTDPDHPRGTFLLHGY